MTILESVFLGLFLLGFLFTILSAVMSGAFGHAFGEGSAMDAGGAHPEAMGGDASQGALDGHAEVGWAQHGLPTFSPLSPTTICAFITAAGGMGYVALAWWEWSPWNAGALSLGSGVAFAALLFGLFTWIFGATQGSTVVTLDSLAGTEAEVSLPIPSGALGEVAFVRNSQRNVMSARCADAAAIPKGTKVVIKSVSSTELIVEETRESWLARTRAQGASSAR